MKLNYAFVTISCVFGASMARVVPNEQAPYVRNDAFTPETVEHLAQDVGKSVLHNHITRHIRPDYSSAFRRRANDDDGGISDFGSSKPQPVRGAKGVPFLAESNTDIDRQNIDYLSPPPTDAGVIPNLKWSFSLSKTRLLKGGWVREQTVTDLPASKEVAAAEQRLAPYAYRELHWHRVAEWAFVLKGSE